MRVPTAATRPLTVTRPSSIQPSIVRREPRPACARILWSFCEAAGVSLRRLARALTARCAGLRLDLTSFAQRLREGSTVHVLELAAGGQTARDPRRTQALGAQEFAHVVSCRLAFDGKVRGEHDLPHHAVGR